MHTMKISSHTLGPQFNINMSSDQYWKSHCGDKTIVRSSYLHNGISYAGKMASLYWISTQIAIIMEMVRALLCFIVVCNWLISSVCETILKNMGKGIMNSPSPLSQSGFLYPHYWSLLEVSLPYH